MANEKDYVVAIDIGTSNIITLVGERAEEGKVRIISSNITPANGMVRGDVRNVEQIYASIERSINDIAEKDGIKVCEAYVTLSGQHIKCSQHSGYVFIKNKDSEVSRTDVDELSESMRNVQVGAGETIIHILPQNYILDGDSDISHPVGMIGKKLEGIFNIVIGGRQNLMHLERCLNRAQIGITDVVLSSLSSAEAVLLDDEKELGVVVVDIGGGTSDVCIYYDKTVRYMGVIPVGGNFINKDIKSVGVLERHVEKLKVKFGSALSDEVPSNKIITLASINNIPSKEIAQKDLASIIEARLIDIIEKLQKILDRAEFKNKLKGPIVLTGGAANTKDIDKLFAKSLGFDVRIASPTMFVTEDSIEKVDSPTYSAAVGLLLKALVIGKPTKTILLQKARSVEPGDVTPEQKPVTTVSNNKSANLAANLYKQQPTEQKEERLVDTHEEVVVPEVTPPPHPKPRKTFFRKIKEVFNPEGLEDDEY